LRDLGADLDTRIELFLPGLAFSIPKTRTCGFAAAVSRELLGTRRGPEASGVRMIFKDDRQENAEAALAIVAVDG
jgi:hypothetical protein